MSFSMENMLKAFQEIQEESDNREKCVHKRESKQRSEQCSPPWDDLSEEKKMQFRRDVSDTWECEQYKERNMKSYSEVEMEVWSRWQKKGK